MTIHHSKGLTFDVCFYLCIDKNKLNGLSFSHSNFLVTADNRVLYPAKAEFYAVEELNESLKSKLSEETYEEICSTYVALTRAKYGMFVILPPLSEKKMDCFTGKSKKYKKIADHNDVLNNKMGYYVSDFLLDCYDYDDFGGLKIDEDLEFYVYQKSPNFSLRKVTGKKKATYATGLNFEFDNVSARRKRIMPSQNDELEQGVRKIHFELPEKNYTLNLGDKVHLFFAKIRDLKSFKLPEDCENILKNHFFECCKNNEFKELLTIKDGNDAWIEKKFDCIINNSWVSGCFDRVNLIKNENGKIIKAEIIDFKSSILNGENDDAKIKMYRRQLFSYRDVLAKMVGVSINSIDCYLIFSRYGKLVKL